MIDGLATSYGRLAGVIAALGDHGFHQAMIDYLSELYAGLNGLVIRYHQRARPEMLINQILSAQIQTIYLDGLYILDPLNNIDYNHFSAGVYSFNESFEIDRDKIRYQEEVFKRARITDELAWLIKLPDASMLAFCLDKPDGQFSAEDLQLAQAELTLVNALTAKHFALEFHAKFQNSTNSFTQIERIVALVNGQTTESLRWRDTFLALTSNEQSLIEQEAVAIKGGDSYREAALEQDHLVSSCRMAIDGEHYLLQRIRPRNAINDTDYKRLINQALENFQLSERERGVVLLSLLGYPNTLIAKKLHISSGTVKNHKYSIYNKLDITSERELFNLVLKNIVGIGGHDLADYH